MRLTHARTRPTCGSRPPVYPRKVDATLDAEQVRDRVAKRIDEFLAEARPELDEISPDVGSLVDTVADFMDGGKRLRALFLYWGWRAAGAADSDAVITAAAAMEFLQACALIHDDVMDSSDSRRGKPAVHRQFEQQHTDAGWAGSAPAFGTAAAILLGDLCLSWADTLLLRSGLPDDALRRGKPVYDSMRTELMAGQYLDILEQARRCDSVEAALQVATYKAAKYTIERPLQLGAALADGDAATISGLRAYGLALGRAFQLRDDLLGVFGDSSVTGKPTGDDLREGKRTALIALALAHSDDDARAVLEAGLGQRDADSATIASLTALISSTPARAEVEVMIRQAADEAREALAAVDIDPAARQQLVSLIGATTTRTA
jgi:geranylgeranyl diphosphate synthase, type I